MRLTKVGKSADCSEALITLGERPEAVHPEARENLENLGYKSTVDYLNSVCQRVLKLGLLPHLNAGVLKESELKRLKQWTASMGLMLESTAELPAHALSPGKDPTLRLHMIKTAGKLHIPLTTGLLIGIGETSGDRIQSLLAIRELHERYGHIQEIIIQPFVPKPNTPMANCAGPSEAELLATVAMARSLMPEMNIQVPPNLLGYNGGVVQLGSCIPKGETQTAFKQPLVTQRESCEINVIEDVLRAGANDFGGISSVTPDFINPEHPWPSVAELRAVIERAGFTPRERLPIYPRYVKDERFMSKKVKKHVLKLADEDGYRAR